MQIQDLLAILRRHVALIVVLILVGGVGGAVVAVVRPASYSSDAKVFISARSASTLDDINTAAQYITQAVASYADIATSAVVLDPVIDRLGLHETSASLKSRITVTAGANETVLDIAAKAPTGAASAALANAVAKQLRTSVQKLTTGRTGAAAALQLTVVDPAVAPAAPDGVGPLTIIAIGLLIGLLVGLVAAVLRETFDTRLRTEQEVALVAGAPVLGLIPRAGHPEAGRLPSFGPAQLEAVRSIRNALRFVGGGGGGGVQSMVITSAKPGEGKSVTAMHLATSHAEAGDRTVLIDADLRSPDLGVPDGAGLTDVLIGRASLDEALHPLPGSTALLLPAGPLAPNPNELLQSAGMRELMVSLRARFDRVVIDSPALVPVSDAAVLAHIADGALVVVGPGTSRPELEAVRARLHQVNAVLLGAVMTMTGRGTSLARPDGPDPLLAADPSELTRPTPTADQQPESSPSPAASEPDAATAPAVQRAAPSSSTPGSGDPQAATEPYFEDDPKPLRPLPDRGAGARSADD